MTESSTKVREIPDFEDGTLRGVPRKMVRGTLRGLLWPSIHMRIVGVENVPLSGPVLAVANHLHNADPVLISVAFPRPLHYMAKKEVFSNKWALPVLTWCGAFPVDRGKADRPAIRNALDRLEVGIAVGMFPEGTRSLTRELSAAHAGAGLIALGTGSPVVPIAITGTERLPLNGSKGEAQAVLPMPEPGHPGVRVLFGRPFTIPREIEGKRTSSSDATDILMIEIARILPPDYRGVYAEPLANENPRRAVPWYPDETEASVFDRQTDERPT